MSDVDANQSNPSSKALMQAYEDQRNRGFLPSGIHSGSERPRFLNQLIFESSPYLLQHSCNPVQWLPWGERAFLESRRQQKPVLLSIGYSTCHWCHVMEKESFEDLEISKVINDFFIPIKVDREERPDVDSYYMNALHLMGQQGGWPSTLFLTPELKPFFGGTYFPARDGDRGVATGFLSILRHLDKVWKEEKNQVIKGSESLTEKLAFLQTREVHQELPSMTAFDNAENFLIHRYDSIYGGHGKAPKFPSQTPYRFLFRQYLRSRSQVAVTMALDTLRSIAGSGIYDVVGGGFHRYATDARWSIPHFEKMLYDNALLAVSYCEAYQISGDPFFKAICIDILDYTLRDMALPTGGFCSATDADSLNARGESEEGFYFSWSESEFSEVLLSFQEYSEVLKDYFGLRTGSLIEGRVVLSGPKDIGSVVKSSGLSERAFQDLIREVRQKLLAVRRLRNQPFRDDKVMISWNGLMISALSLAARVFGRKDYMKAAIQSADLILSRSGTDNTLPRCFRGDMSGPAACLSDYSFLCAGLLELFQINPDHKWIQAAIKIDGVLSKHFEDQKSGGFYQTSDAVQDIPFGRDKPVYDGVEPSGNSVAIMNLLKLSLLTSDDTYWHRAEKAIKNFAGIIKNNPESVPDLLIAYDFYLSQPGLFLGRSGQPLPTKPDERAELLLKSFLPNDLVIMIDETTTDLEPLTACIPSLAGIRQTPPYVLTYCKRNRCIRVSDIRSEFKDDLISQKRTVQLREKILSKEDV